MQFIKKNILLFLCLTIVVWYLFDEFDTMRERVLFIATLIAFVFGMFFSVRLVTIIIVRGFSFREAIIRMKTEIVVWVIGVGILLFFAGLKFTGILLAGLLLWTILITGIYWVWIRVGGKK